MDTWIETLPPDSLSARKTALWERVGEIDRLLEDAPSVTSRARYMWQETKEGWMERANSLDDAGVTKWEGLIDRAVRFLSDQSFAGADIAGIDLQIKMDPEQAEKLQQAARDAAIWAIGIGVGYAVLKLIITTVIQSAMGAKTRRA